MSSNINNEVDLRILKVIDTLILTGVIEYKSEFCEEVGLLKQNLYNIEKGNNSFTVSHILKVISIYNVSADWLFSGKGSPFKRDAIRG